MDKDVSRKIVAVSVVAAAVGIAAYIYFKKRKEDAKKKNLPVSFV